MADLPSSRSDNLTVASSLREFADLLGQQGADTFRVAAYRRAADVVERLREPIAGLFARQGREGLVRLPAIGRSIAAAIGELLTTGRWSQLDRLRGSLEPEKLLRTVPGIGAKLAARNYEELQAESLEALELAAYDGRLAAIRGFGPRRLQMVRASLAERLGRPRMWRARQSGPRPSVAVLLDVDREYRESAAAGKLRKIAPRRFNPAREAWQPILHARRGPWEFTALFSNTRRAHELGKVNDWVVIYYQSDAIAEGQCTVVTETHGPSAGHRVIRGREDECSALSANSPRRSRREGRERPMAANA